MVKLLARGFTLHFQNDDFFCSCNFHLILINGVHFYSKVKWITCFAFELYILLSSTYFFGRIPNWWILHLTPTSPSTKAKITTCWHHLLPYWLGHYIMQQSIFPWRWSKRWHNPTPWSRSWATIISQLMHTSNFHLVGKLSLEKRFYLSPKPFSSQLDYVTKHPPIHPLETHYNSVVDEPQLRSTLITYLVNPTIPSLAVKVKVVTL